MLPETYVLSAVQAINVFSFGAKGDGSSPDATAIQNAASALTPGQGLFFPSTGSGYSISTTAITLPPGSPLYGVAGQSALGPARSTSSGLSLCGDATGMLSATAGQIFDAGGGRFVYAETTAVKPGNAIPGRAANEYLVFLERNNGSVPGVATAWTDNGFTTLEVSDFITPAGDSYTSPCGIILPNGDILVALTHVTKMSIQTWRSSDGGRTWVMQSEMLPSSTQNFGEPNMIRIRGGGTGVPNRIAMVWMDSDPTLTPTTGRNTMYRVAYSNDEGVTWTQPPNNPAVTSAGHVFTNGRAAIYESPTSDRLMLVYTMREPGVPAQIWGQPCDNIGNPDASPVLLTTVPLQTGSGGSSFFITQLVGCSPVVIRLRTGEHALYFTACDYDQNPATGPVTHGTGQLHLMTCPSSAPDPNVTAFVFDRTVSVVPFVSSAQSAGAGYGRPWPVPKPNGEIEIMMFAGGVTTITPGSIVNVVSVIHYGAT